MLTVFGSINIDQVIRVSKLPFPGETTLGERVMDAHGGKGANQAVAAARASGGEVPVAMIGAVGKDEYGQSALKNLRENGVLAECMEYSDCSTGTAIITVSHDGENAITVVSGANVKLEGKHASEEMLKKTSVLLCQGEISLLETLRVITAYRDIRPNGVVIVNLAPVPQDGYLPTLKNVLRGCDILIVNEHEARCISALMLPLSVTNLLPIADQFDLQILITKGAEGVEFLSLKNPVILVSSPKVTPIDTTGAGDTFCGVFAALFAEGLPIKMAVNKACAAAAKACCANGAQTGMPYRAEILTGAVQT